MGVSFHVSKINTWQEWSSIFSLSYLTYSAKNYKLIGILPEYSNYSCLALKHDRVTFAISLIFEWAHVADNDLCFKGINFAFDRNP